MKCQWEYLLTLLFTGNSNDAGETVNCSSLNSNHKSIFWRIKSTDIATEHNIIKGADNSETDNSEMGLK